MVKALNFETILNTDIHPGDSWPHDRVALYEKEVSQKMTVFAYYPDMEVYISIFSKKILFDLNMTVWVQNKTYKFQISEAMQ